MASNILKSNHSQGRPVNKANELRRSGLRGDVGERAYNALQIGRAHV